MGDREGAGEGHSHRAETMTSAAKRVSRSGEQPSIALRGSHAAVRGQRKGAARMPQNFRANCVCISGGCKTRTHLMQRMSSASGLPTETPARGMDALPIESVAVVGMPRQTFRTVPSHRGLLCRRPAAAEFAANPKKSTASRPPRVDARPHQGPTHTTACQSTPLRRSLQHTQARRQGIELTRCALVALAAPAIGVALRAKESGVSPLIVVDISSLRKDVASALVSRHRMHIGQQHRPWRRSCLAPPLP